ncbi:MAG: peptidylprolyl isomerase [Spirochaetales bacterium]|nr:peptidylprolyl isomerase [Spirochaetales bacterium]
MYKKFLLIALAITLTFVSCNNESYDYVEEGENFGVTVDSSGIKIASDDYYFGTEGDVVAVVGEQEIRSDLADDFITRYTAVATKELDERYPEDSEEKQAELDSLSQGLEGLKGRVVEHFANSLAFRQVAQEKGIDISLKRKVAFLNRFFDREFASLADFAAFNEPFNGKAVDFAWQNEMLFYQYVLIFDDFYGDYKVSAKEVKAKYKKMPEDRKIQPEKVEMSFIFVSKEAFDDGSIEKEGEADLLGIEKIERAKDALDGGEEFAAVAKEYSEDMYTASAGGFFGPITRDMSYFPTEVLDAVFGMSQDEVSEIIETEDGFYIVKAGKFTKERTLSADLFYEMIALEVLREKMAEDLGIDPTAVQEKENTFFTEVMNSFDIDLMNSSEEEELF